MQGNILGSKAVTYLEITFAKEDDTEEQCEHGGGKVKTVSDGVRASLDKLIGAQKPRCWTKKISGPQTGAELGKKKIHVLFKELIYFLETCLCEKTFKNKRHIHKLFTFLLVRLSQNKLRQV